MTPREIQARLVDIRMELDNLSQEGAIKGGGFYAGRAGMAIENGAEAVRRAIANIALLRVGRGEP